MSQPAPSPADYTQECREIYDDILTLSDDVRHATGDGAVHYACDFSEIYSYVFPEARSNWMKLFESDTRSTALAVEHAAIGTLFFELSSDLALLRPYALELSGFCDDVVRDAAATVSLDYQTARNEIAKLVASPDFESLRGFLERPDTVVDRPQREAKIKELLETHAGRLVGLARATQRLEPSVRLSRLLRQNEFPRSEQYDLPDDALNRDTVDRWFRELVGRRGKGASRASCYLDAIALATLEAGWLLAPEPKPRTHLVTRSRHMNRLYADERRRGLWNHIPFQLVIHPRAFAVVTASRGKDRDSHSARASLEQLAADLGRFLRAYAPADVNDAATAMGDALKKAGLVDEESADPAALLETVREPWRVAASLKATRYGGLTDELEREKEDRTLILELLSIIRENRQVQELVDQVTTELVGRIREQHQILSRYVSDLKATSGEKSRPSAVMSSAVYWMPFTLQFSSPAVSRWLEQASAGTDVDVLLDVAANDAGPTERYERLLATAYLFGTWRKWQQAKEACLAALTVSKGVTEILEHEAHFMLAICLRHTANGWADYQGAVTALETAGAIKQRLRGDHYDDPRYLKETSFILFAWQSRARDDKRFKPNAPDFAHALAPADRAIARTKDDDRLLCELHNNLCFYYLELKPHDWRRRAAEHCAGLGAALAKKGEPPTPAQTDTLVRAEFVLGLNDNYQGMLDRLTPLVAGDIFSRDERLSVERLIKQIEERRRASHRPTRRDSSRK
jgi:hypothetical protein